MSRAKTKEEARQEFIDAVKSSAKYWAAQESQTDEEKCMGLAHTILCIIDGSAGSFSCGVDLVLRPHDEDKDYHIGNNENWFEDGMILNDDVHLHSIMFAKP